MPYRARVLNGGERRECGDRASAYLGIFTANSLVPGAAGCAAGAGAGDPAATVGGIGEEIIEGPADLSRVVLAVGAVTMVNREPACGVMRRGEMLAVGVTICFGEVANRCACNAP